MYVLESYNYINCTCWVAEMQNSRIQVILRLLY